MQGRTKLQGWSNMQEQAKNAAGAGPKCSRGKPNMQQVQAKSAAGAGPYAAGAGPK